MDKYKISFRLTGILSVVLLSPLFFGRLQHIPEQPLIVILSLLTGFPLMLLLIGLKTRTAKSVNLTLPDVLSGSLFIWLFIRAAYTWIDTGMLLGWIGLLIWYLIFRHFSCVELGRLLYVYPLIIGMQVAYSLISQSDAFTEGVDWGSVKGSFRNTALWGAFLSVVVIISWGQLLYSRRAMWLRISITVCLLAEIFLLLATDSRAAWLCALSGMALLIWWRWSCWAGRWKWLGLAVCLLAGVFLCIWLYHYKMASAYGRLLIWNNCMEMIREKPLWGWGIDGFRRNCMLFQGNYFQWCPDSPYSGLAGNNFYSFNEVLKWVAEQGIAGLILLLVWIGGIIKISVRNHPEGCIAKAGLFGLFVFGQFSYPLSNWQLSFLVVYLFALLAAKSSTKYSFDLHCCPSLIAVVIIGVFVCRSAIVYGEAYKKWDKVIADRTDNSDTTVRIWKEIQPVLKYHPFFLQSYGRRLNENGQYTEACTILHEALQYYATYPVLLELGKSYAGNGNADEAIRYWKQASCMIPVRFMPLFLQMKIYEETGDCINAYQLAEKIIMKKRKLDSPELYMILREARTIASRMPKSE